jgi:hypothetical protein
MTAIGTGEKDERTKTGNSTIIQTKCKAHNNGFASIEVDV